MTRTRLNTLDSQIIAFMKRAFLPTARIALFVVFGWFGILKVIGLSPATPLVQSLFDQTIPWAPFSLFLPLFGVYEVAIGVAFMVPKLERLAIALLLPHMIATSLPLFLVPDAVWTGFLIPTLEGQYIIKNLVLIAAALGIAAHLTPADAKQI